MTDDEVQIYDYTLQYDAQTWLKHTEYADHCTRMQREALVHRLRREGWEAIEEPRPAVMIWSRYVLSEDEYGPVYVHRTCPPEEAETLHRTLEVRVQPTRTRRMHGD